MVLIFLLLRRFLIQIKELLEGLQKLVDGQINSGARRQF
jgi:hypothetical protein